MIATCVHLPMNQSNAPMKALLITLGLIISMALNSQVVEHIKMKSSKKPIVLATVNGQKGYFLVDTGSDISIINSQVLEKYNLEEIKVHGDHKRAIGFNGTQTNVMKIKNVNMLIGDNFDHNQFYSFNLTCIVKSIEAKTNLRITGIIGTDLLMKYNCVIDYSQRHLTLVDGRRSSRLAAK